MRAWLQAARTLVRSIVVTGSVVFCLNPAAANATVLTYYLSRAGFNAADPGLPLEDFQPITDPGLIAAPLSSPLTKSCGSDSVALLAWGRISDGDGTIGGCS